MRAIILYHQYDGIGTLVKTILKNYNGSLSGLIQACASQKSANGIMAAHQIIVLDDDNISNVDIKKLDDGIND